MFHFAALSLVGESMRLPFLYFAQNAALGFALIEACVRHGVSRFILSSTAALFGQAGEIPITEATAIAPGNPYGESKRMIEQALAWADRIHALRSACLRYFNAAGSDPQGARRRGPRSRDASDPAGDRCRRPPLTLFGEDYPTPDGTCIRDYVHVSDLAAAHLDALDCLDAESVTFNLGSASSYSVLEVIRSMEPVTGRKVPTTIGAHRLAPRFRESWTRPCAWPSRAARRIRGV